MSMREPDLASTIEDGDMRRTLSPMLSPHHPSSSAAVAARNLLSVTQDGILCSKREGRVSTYR